MKNLIHYTATLALFCLLSVQAQAIMPATTGQIGLAEVKQCVMQNDAAYCHSIMTPESYAFFDRFESYKLMPCLPSDFTYESEQPAGSKIIVKANLQAAANKHYIFRLVFDQTASGPKINIAESFHAGLGEKWENKVQLSEQLYLMMKQNMGDKLTCDMLNNLLVKK
jgi:hypothetical protein